MKAVAGALMLALGAGLLIEPPAHAARELRGVAGLARAYDSILDAAFDQVEPELQKACSFDSPGSPALAQDKPAKSSQVRAPREACEVLAATALWWRIQLDPDSRALDPQFSDAVDAAIASTEAWAERSPTDAEAWFYMGGAYAARVQWRVLRDQKLSAARDGKRILQALEEALRLDPSLDDAYFGMGMYRYYADVAPTAAKILRFLLLLPGGDRKVGLEQMLRARTRGRLLQGEADYQLSIIYLWYENQIPRAITLLEQLHERYPGNPLFLAEIAHIQDAYQHDLTASLATWHALLASAREPRANAPGLAETRARLGIAQKLDELHQTDLAIEHLHAVIDRQPTAPFGSLPLAYLRLGEAHDRLGARADAVAAYRTAERLIPSPDVHEIRNAVSRHLRRTPDAKQAEAYRWSLSGWRLFEMNDLTAAATALERALALNGTDPVARYRMGRVQQALKRDPAALAQFEMAIRHAKRAPTPILGDTYLEAARLHERAGRREAALSYYRIAASLFGAAADTRTAATRAITRLRDRDVRAPHR
ncbi:MAG: tetratricopeptide repeat protein [Vicinamibacterales bacterium]